MRETNTQDTYESTSERARTLFPATRLDDEFFEALDEQFDAFHGENGSSRLTRNLPPGADRDIIVLNAYMEYRRHQINESLERHVDVVANDQEEATLMNEYVGGGERFAGVLTYLAGEVFGTPEVAVKRQAIIAELVMNSFLITDDVLDGHRVRRGTDSIWYKMEREHGFGDSTPFGIANLYQNKLLQRAYQLADGDELSCLTGPVNTAITGALAEAIHRNEGIHYLTHEEWRQFSMEVSSGLRIPFLLPATDHASIHPAQELGRSFGLFEQTVDNAVDGQLPSSMDAETEIVRNAEQVLAAAQKIDADTRIFDILVPWFFYMYFYTHSHPDLPPELLYHANLGLYEADRVTYPEA